MGGLAAHIPVYSLRASSVLIKQRTSYFYLTNNNILSLIHTRVLKLYIACTVLFNVCEHCYHTAKLFHAEIILLLSDVTFTFTRTKEVPWRTEYSLRALNSNYGH